jgi:lysophospholipase L1-like esterase
MQIFKSEAARAMLALLVVIGLKTALLGYDGVVEPLAWPTGQVRSWGENLVETMSSRSLNKEAREALTAGYYEGLMNEGSRLSAMNRLVTDNRPPTFEVRTQPDRRESGDFLFYELIPNSDIPDYQDARARYRLKTNSAGFADKEYTIEKPDGVRRIAVMGDSITRGQGAPFGGTYEALLEDKLKQSHRSESLRGYEVLNFAVGSYTITQQLGMAVERAVRYQPDVYVFGITQLSVYRNWGSHIALLTEAGADLKYDYLRQLVRDADLKAWEPIGVFDAKLAKFRLPTIRWALSEMSAHARRQGAAMIVVLVPEAATSAAVEELFLGVRGILQDLGIPVVDLLDTFDGRDDLASLRVADNDWHPNAAGHQLLFGRLYAKVMNDPALRQALFGSVNPPREPK